MEQADRHTSQLVLGDADATATGYQGEEYDTETDSLDVEEEEEEDDDYETLRLRRIQENQLLLDSLGIQSATLGAASSSTSILSAAVPRVPMRRNKVKRAVYDRAGYILGLPQEGETHRVAAVEMPSDRKLLRRIAEGEYQDCTSWAEGEARRWRFGFGKSRLDPEEEDEVGGVGEDFRWRKWHGLAEELRRELKQLGRLAARDTREQHNLQYQLDEGVSAYSLIPGAACHQCRRKSEKLKMKCRKINPECRATFCETCCKRYSYFSFDPHSRSFICPLCRNICNCSNCIRKRNLSHLLNKEKNGIRTKSLTTQLRVEGKGDMTVEAWLALAEAMAVAPPFDRIRLVDRDTDIISPELPPQIIPIPEPTQAQIQTTPAASKKKQMAKRGRGRPTALDIGGEGTLAEVVAKKKKTGVKTPRSSKVGSKEKSNDSNQTLFAETPPKKKKSFIIKIKVPPKLTKPVSPEYKEKELDSDGDTVAGCSDEYPYDARSRTSTLTPLSDASFLKPTPKPKPRLAFPPRGTVLDPDEIYRPMPPTLSDIILTQPSDDVDITMGEHIVDSPPTQPYDLVVNVDTAQIDMITQDREASGVQPLPPALTTLVYPTESPAAAVRVPARPPLPLPQRAMSNHSDSSEGPARRRQHRKPPPRANIIRIPRHLAHLLSPAVPVDSEKPQDVHSPVVDPAQAALHNDYNETPIPDSPMRSSAASSLSSSESAKWNANEGVRDISAPIWKPPMSAQPPLHQLALPLPLPVETEINAHFVTPVDEMQNLYFNQARNPYNNVYEHHGYTHLDHAHAHPRADGNDGGQPPLVNYGDLEDQTEFEMAVRINGANAQGFIHHPRPYFLSKQEQREEMHSYSEHDRTSQLPAYAQTTRNYDYEGVFLNPPAPARPRSGDAGHGHGHGQTLAPGYPVDWPGETIHPHLGPEAGTQYPSYQSHQAGAGAHFT